MTNREFEELLKIIDEKRIAHARAIKNKGTLPNPKGRLNRYIANGICFAGYRKADEVRKETAREIFSKLSIYAQNCQAVGYDGIGPADIAEVAAEYGVEEEKQCETAKDGKAV